jgi:hypothetical protein
MLSKREKRGHDPFFLCRNQAPRTFERSVLDRLLMTAPKDYGITVGRPAYYHCPADNSVNCFKISSFAAATPSILKRLFADFQARATRARF